MANLLFVRPVRELLSGRLKVACPASYAHLPGYKPPYCPHVANEFRVRSSCEMKVKQVKIDGKLVYVFKAPSHACRFIGVSYHCALAHSFFFLLLYIVPIPYTPLPKKHIMTQEELDDFNFTQDAGRLSDSSRGFNHI